MRKILVCLWLVPFFITCKGPLLFLGKKKDIFCKGKNVFTVHNWAIMDTTRYFYGRIKSYGILADSDGDEKMDIKIDVSREMMAGLLSKNGTFLVEVDILSKPSGYKTGEIKQRCIYYLIAFPKLPEGNSARNKKRG